MVTFLVGIGSVVSLPGSVIHAGPACDAPRAIIFFTSGFIEKGTEVMNKEKRTEAMKKEIYVNNAPIHELYNKDVQFNTVSLFIEIMATVWPEITDATHKLVFYSSDMCKLQSQQIHFLFMYISLNTGQPTLSSGVS